MEHLHILERLHVDESPSTIVYKTPEITHEMICDVTFPRKCAGCDRIFASPENYTQHFFVPGWENLKLLDDTRK